MKPKLTLPKNSIGGQWGKPSGMLLRVLFRTINCSLALSRTLNYSFTKLLNCSERIFHESMPMHGGYNEAATITYLLFRETY